MTRSVNNRLSIYAIGMVALVAIINCNNLKFWNRPNRIIAWDVISYYAYLPATFIYHDVTLEFTDADPQKFGDKFWPLTTEYGAKVIKTSMGVAYCYLPSFIAGHITAKLTHYEANGYSVPYRFFLQAGGVFFMLLALWYLRGILLVWFSDRVTAITLILVTFATNLYFYSTLEAAYSHVYSFFLFILFIRETIRFYERPSVLNIVLLGFTAGLITLIRPSNIIVLLIFLLWGISGPEQLRQRVRLLLSRYRLVMVMALLFILPWIPQLLYWKEVTGHWLYYSYQDEGFFFGNPNFFRGLFGFRKGLFIYTPLALFMWGGIFMLKGKLASARPMLVLFTLANSYIILSWWCWWYGGSFGQRPFIDSYGLYAIPLAAFIEAVLRMKIRWRMLFSSLFLGMLLLGVFQTAQYYYGAIHWDSMTRAAWFDSFGRLHPSEKFHSLLSAPDYEKAQATGEE